MLGGIHLHQLACLHFNSNIPPQRMAALALVKLLRNPLKYQVIKSVKIMFVDEIGQLSAEILTALDIIFRKVRSSDMYMGGILLICTMDHRQLEPVNGRPFLTLPNIVSCFEFYELEYSVRAHEPDLERLQYIARLNPRRYEENPALITEFKNLAKNLFTFVRTWSDPAIRKDTIQLYGRYVLSNTCLMVDLLQKYNHFINHFC